MLWVRRWSATIGFGTSGTVGGFCPSEKFPQYVLVASPKIAAGTADTCGFSGPAFSEALA